MTDNTRTDTFGKLRITATWEIPEDSDATLETAVFYEVEAALGGQGHISSATTSRGSLRGIPFVKITKGTPEDADAPYTTIDFALSRLRQRGKRNLAYIRVPSGSDWLSLRPSVTITQPQGESERYVIRSPIKTLPICAVAIIDWIDDTPRVWPCLKFEENVEPMIRRLTELTRFA